MSESREEMANLRGDEREIRKAPPRAQTRDNLNSMTREQGVENRNHRSSEKSSVHEKEKNKN